MTITLNPAIDQTLVIPSFAAGQVNRVASTHSKPGGKGVNVAATLADHGLKTAVTGFLGSENAGIFESFFNRLKIADFFLRAPGSTRIGLKIVDPTLGKTTDINFPGIELTASDFKKLLARVQELADGAWFVLSGSLPPGVPASVYCDLGTILKSAGCSVALDTSGEAFRLGIESTPNFVKPNRHELAAFVGHPLPDRASVCHEARELLRRGIELVVVSMDEEGALFITKEEALCARPPGVKVNSTVGAGDAMVAGIIAAQLRGLALDDCARMATAFSLDLLTRQPADPASPSRVAEWRESVVIEPV